MNLIRLTAVLAIGWTLLALGAGALGVGTPLPAGSTFYIATHSVHDALPVAAPSPFGPEQYRLVDRTTGKFEPLPVPESERWGLLAVSPWRDSEGNLEAVGRWVTRPDAKGNGEFCGVGIFRLSDATVKERISMDKLPTGRPCWVPGRPGDFLFPVGDGLLYRWRASGGIGSAAGATPDERGSRTADGTPELCAVKWECTPPGAGLPILDDPVWSSEPALKRFVLVALSLQKSVGDEKGPRALQAMVAGDERTRRRDRGGGAAHRARGRRIANRPDDRAPAKSRRDGRPHRPRLSTARAGPARLESVRGPARDRSCDRPAADRCDNVTPPRARARTRVLASPVLAGWTDRLRAHPSSEIVGYAIRGQSAAIAAPGA